eukprot:SAG31_NODE_9992_length_1200_cov_1.349682_2_plen_104_part_00
MKFHLSPFFNVFDQLDAIQHVVDAEAPDFQIHLDFTMEPLGPPIPTHPLVVVVVKCLPSARLSLGLSNQRITLECANDYASSFLVSGCWKIHSRLRRSTSLKS